MTSLVQLYPNRLTITPERSKDSYTWSHVFLGNNVFVRLRDIKTIDNFKAVKNPFNISKSSKRKMMDSINTMYQLSRSRKITMKTGKHIYNYKMSFITLTLPSAQMDSDVTIKKTCLNQFLVELRKNYGIKNYVWKAELQENQNVHFHLLLDKYVDFQALRRRWNRCINKLGYVDAYQAKMSKLSLIDYNKLRNKEKNWTFDKARKAYAKGKQHNWKNPNSVDVRSVFSKRELAIYLAKYIAKTFNLPSDSKAVLERQISFGRSWFRSYSLSQIKFNHKFVYDEIIDHITYLKSETKKVLHIVGDYFQVFYFSVEELQPIFKNFHQNTMQSFSRFYNYPIP